MIFLSTQQFRDIYSKNTLIVTAQSKGVGGVKGS
jgi:hypothetical protein